MNFNRNDLIQKRNYPGPLYRILEIEPNGLLKVQNIPTGTLRVLTRPEAYRLSTTNIRIVIPHPPPAPPGAPAPGGQNGRQK